MQRILRYLAGMSMLLGAFFMTQCGKPSPNQSAPAAPVTTDDSIPLSEIPPQDFPVYTKEHLAVNCQIALQSQYQDQYSAGGPAALVDGLLANHEYKHPAWQGYYGNSMEAVLDLGRPYTLKKIVIRCLIDHENWIFAPLQIYIGTSTTGQNFQFAQMMEEAYPERKSDTNMMEYHLELRGIETQYLQVKVGGIGTCPDWHPGAGKPAWLFIDEIIVQ